MSSCKDCEFWDIANTRHGSPDKPDEFGVPGDEDYRKPHANLDWSLCRAALEGWTNETHYLAPKMAIFDGSGYAAELWTRHDHLCAEFRDRRQERAHDHIR